MELIKTIREEGLEIPVIAMSFDPPLETAEQARRQGATLFVKKPFATADELAIHVSSAFERKTTHNLSPWVNFQNASESIKSRYPHAIVVSQEQLRLVEIAACNPEIAVCIYGETGTGKEELAKLIHRARCRYSHIPFVSLNCANLSGELLLSTLFGHRKGAFTGATENFIGMIGQANGGILFLDEIHRLSLNAQEKLLRVINDGTYQRVGDTKEILSKFQLVIASSKDLDQEVDAGHFLIDLRMRMIGLEVQLPPLRERKHEIPDLLQLFFAKQDRPVTISATEARKLADRCSTFYWQGNIRQLFKVLQTYIITASMNSEELKADHLPVYKTMLAPGEFYYSRGQSEGLDDIINDLKKIGFMSIKFDALMDKVERIVILETIKRCSNVKEACEALNLPRSTLDAKRKKYSI